jgi:hypothetical protein
LPQATNIAGELWDIYFLPGTVSGYAVGDHGAIIHTENGGSDWILQASGVTDTLNSVFFLDQQEGWIAGQNGIILHTTNGGTNWEKLESGTTHWLKSIIFIDTSNGWATGNGGVILHTTDRGNTWINEAITDGPMNAIFFTPDQKGWVVGDGGSILHFEGMGPVRIPGPGAFSNHFNMLLYPNPTSGYTTLEFDLSASTIVEVYLFDLHGRLVLAPTQTGYQTGHQSVVLDATTLIPGVYVVRLKAGDKWAIQKMFKLK